MILDAKVLVVDDIASNRFIIITHLKKQNITNIVEAENGSEAIECLIKYKFDLVLLDVMMPEVNGYEVLKWMKKNKEFRHIPVIMITALDDMAITVKCIESGAEDYLSKPFNPVLLRARVTACLEKKHLRDVEREYLRLYDFATGLPNRDLFLKRLKEALHRWRLYPSLFSVLLIRLGKYRMILDGLGQGAGDDFLIAQAKRLGSMVPPNSFLACLGHNEFAVLLNDLSHAADGNSLARKIHDELEKPLKIREHDISGSVTVGLSFSSSEYETPEDMFRDASLAANKAEQTGGYQIFDENMHKEAMKRLEMEIELKAAIQEKQLILYYQPIITFASKNIISFEALVRWLHPTKGMVPPDEFIGLAEETGLIIPLGTWVLEEACRQAARWKSLLDEKARMTIGVNVSAHQFTKTGFIDILKNAIYSAGLKGSELKLELTETALIDNPDQVEHVLNQVRDLNIKTALDDFGTGYCSLSYLHRFPFDSLKIDRSFVSHIDVEQKNHEIVSSTIALAHKLGMEVIAEGIETYNEEEALRRMNCDCGQGIFFSSPLPEKEAADRLLNDNA